MAESDLEDRAVAAVRAHHAELAGRLDELAAAVLAAATPPVGDRAGQAGAPAGASADGPTVLAARELAGYASAELIPHAVAEEGTLYRAAADRQPARLLVTGMLAEHRVLAGLVEELATGTEPVRLAGAARALQVLFDVHLAKENDLVLPLLAADPTVSVAELLHGMHELLGSEG